jgi:hypothetical protein
MPRSKPAAVLSVSTAVLLVAAAVAAQKLEIETHMDPKADFSTVRTYAWLPPAPVVQAVAPGIPTNPTLTQEALGPHIVAAVDRHLKARGLTPAGPDEADVQMVYFAAMTVGFSQSYLGEHYGYVTGWGAPIPLGIAPSTSVSVYEKGTVLVDMIQRAAKRGIWRGTAVTRIDQEKTLDQRVKRINQAVDRMFEKFPIRQNR